MSSGCVLCARPGSFQSTPASGLAAALCPQCRAAARPTRGGLEQAVLITAGQALADADRLRTESATAAELDHHLRTVSDSLRTLLRLFDADPPG